MNTEKLSILAERASKDKIWLLDGRPLLVRKFNVVDETITFCNDRTYPASEFDSDDFFIIEPIFRDE